MDTVSARMIILGVIGLCLAAISAWSASHEDSGDASGFWGLCAVLFLISSCEQGN